MDRRVMELPMRRWLHSHSTEWSMATLADELPLGLFLVFNGTMAWLAWSLSTDVRHWRGLIDAGELALVPLREPRTSEIILAGVPHLWLIGAGLLGCLALYWHARFVRGEREVVRS